MTRFQSNHDAQRVHAGLPVSLRVERDGVVHGNGVAFDHRLARDAEPLRAGYLRHRRPP